MSFEIDRTADKIGIKFPQYISAVYLDISQFANLSIIIIIGSWKPNPGSYPQSSFIIRMPRSTAIK